MTDTAQGAASSAASSDASSDDGPFTEPAFLEALRLAKATGGAGGAIDRLMKSACRFAQRHTHGLRHQDAEDAQQEFCLKLLRRFREVPLSIPYLVRMRRNAAEDVRRRRQRGRCTNLDEVEPASSAGSPVGADESPEPSPVLMDAVQRLGPRRREIVRLHIFEKMPHEQIAERLRISSVNSRVLLHRALLKLRGLATLHGLAG